MFSSIQSAVAASHAGSKAYYEASIVRWNSEVADLRQRASSIAEGILRGTVPADDREYAFDALRSLSADAERLDAAIALARYRIGDPTVQAVPTRAPWAGF